MMTAKQYHFLASLLATREGCTMTVERLDREWEAGSITKLAATRLIDEALRRPKAPREPLEPGLYLIDGTVYKVQVSQTGNAYAKVLDADTGKFEYMPGAIRAVTPDSRLTLEQAKEYGVSHGHCAVCGRELTVEASVAAGIGPVCIKRFGR